MFLQGFSSQGWQIPSIPCETGVNANTASALANKPNKPQSNEKVVTTLGGIMDTFDNLL